jgi:hypothetical protein
MSEWSRGESLADIFETALLYLEEAEYSALRQDPLVEAEQAEEMAKRMPRRIRRRWNAALDALLELHGPSAARIVDLPLPVDSGRRAGPTSESDEDEPRAFAPATLTPSRDDGATPDTASSSPPDTSADEPDTSPRAA